MSGPATTCGCNAPRVQEPFRCVQCGRVSHHVGDGYRVPPRMPGIIGWLIEFFERLHARLEKKNMPQFEGRVVRSDHE